MAVRRVKGVERVDGDTKARTVTIQFDPSLAAVDGIRAAMDGIGYETEEV